MTNKNLKNSFQIVNSIMKSGRSNKQFKQCSLVYMSDFCVVYHREQMIVSKCCTEVFAINTLENTKMKEQTSTMNLLIINFIVSQY